VRLRSLFLTAILWLAPPAAGRASARPRAAARANPRTGLLVTHDEALVRAVKRKDRAALERLAERMGPARLAQSLHRSDPAVVAAALVALPYVRGAVTLVGAVTDLVEASDAVMAGAASGALGELLDGTSPALLDDWEVPPDQLGRACAALRTLAGRVEAPVPSRLAALVAMGDAATVCTATGELAPLLRDPVPAVRRATALLLRPEERRASSGFRDVIHDPDPAVASAAVAAVCRAEGRDEDLGAGASAATTAGRPDAMVQQTVEAARALVLARGTPPEDAVEMLGCLAQSSAPADRRILDQLRRGAPSPLRDRAVELSTRPAELKPR
jgi:hypothetical protein